MKSSIRAKKVLQKWSVMLILLAVTAVLSAPVDRQKLPLQQRRHPRRTQPGARSPAQHIDARRSTPREYQRPGGASSNNRGPGGQVPTIAGREVTRQSRNHRRQHPYPSGRQSPRCEWCEPWWRQRQPSPDGSRSRGAGANHNAANAGNHGAAGANAAHHQPAAARTSL